MGRHSHPSHGIEPWKLQNLRGRNVLPARQPNQYEATNRVGFCPNPDLAR
jgi:hypothetical protein